MREEARNREKIVKERLKIEGKIDLEMAGLEFSQEHWIKRKEEQSKGIEFEMIMLKEKEELLRKKEKEVKRKESMAVRKSSQSTKRGSAIIDDDPWLLDDKENMGPF